MVKKVESTKEKVASKKAVKPVVKSAAPKKVTKVVEKEARKSGDLKVTVYGADGKSAGTMSLPEAVFAAKVNKPLMAQAVRVYLANQREGSAGSKTRGEVEGSTRKIYKQKGTGRARHGSIRAPIFVKGGVALGPKPHDFTLDLPKKMKKKAVTSALTAQLMKDGIKVVNDLKTLELKTKVFASLFETLSITRKTLVLLGKEEKEVTRAMNNLPYVNSMTATDVNTYAVLHHRDLLITKNGLKELEGLFV